MRVGKRQLFGNGPAGYALLNVASASEARSTP